MKMQQQPEKKRDSSLKVLGWIVGGWAATINPFMRKNIGKRHPGITGLVGMAWLTLWIAYTQAQGLVYMIPVYVLGQFFHRVGSRNSEVHSHYVGEPVLARMIGFKNDAAARQIGEPLIAFVIGIAMIACGFDEGKYFAFGSGAMAINEALLQFREQRTVDDMRDGMIEGRYFMGRARERSA